MSLIQTAFAQSSCVINGQEVPCGDFFRSVGLFSGIGIGLIILFAAIGIAALVFWLINLIHAIRNPVDSKALWIIIMLFFGIVGAVIYYFAIKRPYDNQYKVI